MNRRDILRGAIAFSVSAPATIGIVAYDPIIQAIDDFRDSLQAYNDIPNDVLTTENEPEYIAATYGGPEGRLLNWDMPALSRDGAIAALRFMEEKDMFADSLGEPLRRAVLGYLEGLPA